MPYSRVWIPELNAYKIIGEDTGEYEAARLAMPEATQFNLTAKSGVIVASSPDYSVPGVINEGEVIAVAKFEPTPVIAQPESTPVVAQAAFIEPKRGVAVAEAAMAGVDEMDLPQFTARDIVSLLQYIFGGR